MCTDTRSMHDGWLFCFENRPKRVLKDMVVYALTFHCNCSRFEVFMTIFKFSNWHKKNSLIPKKSYFFFYWILALMHQTITCKLKSSEKDFSRQFYIQNYYFAIFVPNIYASLASHFSLLQKQSIWTGTRMLRFLIFPFSMQTWKKKKEKKKKKKTHTHTNKVYAFLNHLRIVVKQKWFWAEV